MIDLQQPPETRASLNEYDAALYSIMLCAVRQPTISRKSTALARLEN
jgi:hypothetical protein